MLVLFYNQKKTKGLESGGLFKTYVAPEKVNAIVNKINAGLPVEFGTDCDTYTTANVIKKFLYSLPTPLCAKKTKTVVGNGTGVYEVQAMVQAMPTANQHLLRELCALLYEVSFHSHINLMSTDHLATAIGPLLFFTSSDPVAFPGHAHSAVCIMIDHFTEVFKSFPSRSVYNMSRSASDIPPKSAPLSPPHAQPPLTPQLRPSKPMSAATPHKGSKKKLLALPKLPRASPHTRVLVPPYRIVW